MGRLPQRLKRMTILQHQHKTFINARYSTQGKMHPIDAYHRDPVTRASHNLTCHIDGTDKYKQSSYQCPENNTN
jgi:hypothetical protein